MINSVFSSVIEEINSRRNGKITMTITQIITTEANTSNAFSCFVLIIWAPH